MSTPMHSSLLNVDIGVALPAWSIDRHQMIGIVADRRLSGPVRNKVRDILAPGGSSNLGQVAGWADFLKGSSVPTDDETKKFLANPDNKANHGRWHYLNLPFAATKYDPVALAKFIPANGHHVVAKVVDCARALVNPTPQLSRTNALRWLTHLIGDLHQPMHLGCSFIDLEQKLLIGDPAAIDTQPSDRGGNNLRLPSGGQNLHSYWDGVLANVNDTKIEAAAASVVPPDVTLETVEKVVAGWVEDTLRVSRDAYWSVGIDQVLDDQPALVKIKWSNGLGQYEQRNEPHVARQMARAAVRLATLVTALVS